MLRSNGCSTSTILLGARSSNELRSIWHWTYNSRLVLLRRAAAHIKVTSQGAWRHQVGPPVVVPPSALQTAAAPYCLNIYTIYSCSKTTHMHIDKTDKIKIETAGQLYYMMCEVLSNLPKVRCPDSAAGLSADVKKIYQL